MALGAATGRQKQCGVASDDTRTQYSREKHELSDLFNLETPGDGVFLNESTNAEKMQICNMKWLS